MKRRALTGPAFLFSPASRKTRSGIPRYPWSMRAPLALLLGLAAACDCGGYPSGTAGDDRGDPPRAPACGIPTAPPVAIHELGAGERIAFGFSACGHLWAGIAGPTLLAEPDLGALVQLPRPEGWPSEFTAFSPTGELLFRSGATGQLLRDLATGEEHALTFGEQPAFHPSHDSDRSILVRCTPEGLVAWDRGEERRLVPGAIYDRYSFGAVSAPVTVAATADEELLIVDAERGTVRETGLPWVESREEPAPGGELGYRADQAYVSWDGRLVLHAQRWELFRGDYVELVGNGVLTILDTETGATQVHAAHDGYLPFASFDTGFAWLAGPDRTLLVGAPGRLEIDHRCDLAERAIGGRALLLTCHHQNPSTWHDYLVDTSDFRVEDLGEAWSVREISSGGTAVAGCPRDAWRGGCTVPTVRRWTRKSGMRDISLDRAAEVVWVGDDGTVLALDTGGAEALLLDPSGGVKTRFPVVLGSHGGYLRVFEFGDVLLLLILDGSLDVVVPASGAHVRLTDIARDAVLDDRGERVAYTVPDGEGVRLFAGAVPR